MTYQIKQREAELRGEERGERKNAIETARRMLLKSMPVDLVAELSGLSLSEVNALKASMAN